MLAGKTIVVFGGTGSLGKLLVKRLLAGECGYPKKVIVVSRDEAKQHQMRLDFQSLTDNNEGIIYRDSVQILQFRIGDIRDFRAVQSAMRDADCVINAAALKQVPTCEYFPFEAVQTNILGTENLIQSIRENNRQVEIVIGISTDKACQPVNVMGMTKALQERMLGRASLDCPDTRFTIVRYGNVLASRGSVVPLFQDQIKRGGPITITSTVMTRFLLSLDDAVDTIFAALRGGNTGEIYVPVLPAARIVDVATALIDGRPIEIKVIGVRPGEKEHETLVSEEEANRTTRNGSYYVVLPILPELRKAPVSTSPLEGAEYNSALHLLTRGELHDLLKTNNLMVEKAAGSTSHKTQSHGAASSDSQSLGTVSPIDSAVLFRSTKKATYGLRAKSSKLQNRRDDRL
jgi:FlaA1/EpsC-like NDP-sugar epimerase